MNIDRKFYRKKIKQYKASRKEYLKAKAQHDCKLLSFMRGEQFQEGK